MYLARKISLRLLAIALSAVVPQVSPSQSVQPAIVEYSSKADGKFAVTNNTASPMTVILEPKSFSIASDGRGIFRPLDPDINVELSTMSVRLQPLQTYWVFYKASAETYPAWFTVYSTFVPLRKGDSLNVRFQLPHTVYLYQKPVLTERDVESVTAKYLPGKRILQCDVKNVSKNLGRVQDVQISAVHGAPVQLAGFPLLPGGERHLEFYWEGKEPPATFRIRFPHFSLRSQVTVDESDASSITSSEVSGGLEDHAPGQ